MASEVFFVGIPGGGASKHPENILRQKHKAVYPANERDPQKSCLCDGGKHKLIRVVRVPSGYTHRICMCKNGAKYYYCNM